MPVSPASSHGGGGLPLAGGTLTGPLLIDYSGGDGSLVPLEIKAGFNAQAVDFISVVNSDLNKRMAAVDSSGGLVALDHTTGNFLAGLSENSSGGVSTGAITSGALPTVAPVSGAAFTLAPSRDLFLCIPFTGDASNNAATLKIELSPDNVTFSILDTLSIAAALNLTGAINVPITVLVPENWYVKLTAVHGTIGTATYY